MKAFAVFPGKKSFEMIEHPEPYVRDAKDVKLRVLEVGICGTDKEIAHFDYGTPPAESEYLVLGHESLAEVVDVGSEVTKVKPGDLVVPTVRRPCSSLTCIPCRQGRQDFCMTGNFTERGIKEAHGYMAEWVVEKEDFLSVLPPGLRESGVLIEPLTIAEKAVEQLWTVQSRLPWSSPHEPGRKSAYRHHAVVLGAGPVGLLGAMKLVHDGFETTVFSRSGGMGLKREIVESIGAYFADADQLTIEQVKERRGEFDVVYEAVGASSLAFETIKHLDANGIFLFTGVPGRKAPVSIDTDLLMRNLVLRNQSLIGTVNADMGSFQRAADDLADFVKRWPDTVKAIISHRVHLDRVADALSGKIHGIKTVVTLQ